MPIAKDCTDCRLEECYQSSRLRDFATSDSLDPRFRVRNRNLHETWPRTHPVGSSESNVEA
eukprot:14475417-Alexandrium_andersonii.AAC.1